MSVWTNPNGRVLTASPGSSLERVLSEDSDWTCTDDEVVEADPDPRMSQSRPDLNDMAREAGVIEPEALRTKADVLAAINELGGGTDV